MNRRSTLDIFRKYYLNEIPNPIVLYIMFCFSTICIMKLITPIQTALTELGIIATVGGITTVVIYEYFKAQIKKQFHDKANEKDKEEPFSISRNVYMEKLKNAKGLLFLLGESGAGKSYILEQLEENLSKTTQCISIRNNYFESWQQMNDKEYIIFDQFEKILDISEPLKKINIIKSLINSDRTIVLSLRKEYFGEIYKMFEYHGDYLWIEYNIEDKAQIIAQLYNLIGEENIFDKLDYTLENAEQKISVLYSDIKNNKITFKLTLLKQVILDVIENKILFIQLSYLGRILQQDNNDVIKKAENDWLEYRDYDILIMHFIEEQIDSFIYSDSAYLILFLLCQDTKGIYANMNKDFKNVSLQSDEIINIVLKYLKEIQLILPIKSDDNLRSSSISQYEISHEYILDILLTLCNNKLDTGIRNNITFYNREYQIKRNEYSIQEAHPKMDLIEKQCEKYIDNKNEFLHLLLWIMLLFIIGINSYYLWFYQPLDYKSTYLRLFYTNITTTVSTYYIFNYYHHFMKIFDYRYWIGVIMAMVSVIISYLCADYWAIGYGCEIFIVGIIMSNVAKKTRYSEKTFFMDRYRNFCAIGGIVIVLSLYYHLYTNGNMILAWPCYFLYAAYMLLGIIGHINKPYILSMLGKVLYKDWRKDIK